MELDLLREFETVQRTRFWEIFWNFLFENREAAANRLCRDAQIGGPAVLGDVWQERFRVIDQIIAAPSRIVDGKLSIKDK